MPFDKNSQKCSYRRTINLQLDEEALAFFETWTISPEERIALVEVLGEQGYKIGYDYDPKRDLHSFYCQGSFEECPNPGLRIYGNANTAAEALKMLLFKVTVVMEGRKWDEFHTPYQSRSAF